MKKQYKITESDNIDEVMCSLLNASSMDIKAKTPTEHPESLWVFEMKYFLLFIQSLRPISCCNNFITNKILVLIFSSLLFNVPICCEQVSNKINSKINEKIQLWYHIRFAISLADAARSKPTHNEDREKETEISNIDNQRSGVTGCNLQRIRLCRTRAVYP